MIKFPVLHRMSGAVKFTAEIDCEESENHSIKLGLAVSWALKNKANLTGANLTWADLTGANLTRANLTRANLTGADLTRADLKEIKKDFFERLTLAKNEAQALYDYIMRGLVDGSSYTGECACFVGTVAKICDQNYENLTNGLKPDCDSATEIFFFGIRQGDDPKNNQVSSIVAEWTEDFMIENGILIPEYKLISSLEYHEMFKKED